MSKILNILITEKAKEDIVKISDYIAKDNPKVAIDTLILFEKTFKMLALFPNAGVNKAILKDKSVLIYNVKKLYSIAYRINKNNIEIVRILTHYQDIFAIL